MKLRIILAAVLGAFNLGVAVMAVLDARKDR